MTEAVAEIGHNNPPVSPFDAVRVNIEDLYTEAKHWADGEPIQSQAHADRIEALLDLIREAHTAADNARKQENQPFDDGKAEVQARYAPLIADTKAVTGKTVMAIAACKAALAPWRLEQERLKKIEADKAIAAAAAAAQASADLVKEAQADDLDAKEKADAAIKVADQASRVAVRAGKAASTGTGLRSYWSPTLIDGVAAARHYWETNRPAMEEALLALAKVDVQNGKRTLPGFAITEDRRAF